MKIFVGSRNQVKVQSVKQAFEAVWPNEEWEVEGFSVQSGVSEQPLDELETITGARNRANELMNLGGADYVVGIEGGLIHSAGRWMECGWVVILNREGWEGIAASAKMVIPDSIYEVLQTGATLNDACSKFFGIANAGETMGYFGLMTNGAVDRMRAYTDAVSFALARFTQPQLFEEEG